MHDIKFIRENPDAFDEALKKRFADPQAQKILELDKQKREKQTRQQDLQASRNDLSAQIGAKKKAGESAEELQTQVANIKEEIANIEEELNAHGELEELLAACPNILADDVPVGKDEAENVEIKKVGEKPEFDFTPKDHFELSDQINAEMDFETAAKISGARFVLLKNKLAKLERALANFMLDIHASEFDMMEVVPPLLVRSHSLYGTGQLPKFSEDSYKVDGQDYWLIPTSEVPLTNIVREEILDGADLPMRFCAYSPCFRSEAGSAGKDTRGMIRHHQFSKVEMVAITDEENSITEHERMLGAAEEVLKRLGLHYRVVKLCSGDTGFGATKTYDIEVWLPGQNAYREISSVSNCAGFQARRMNARYAHADNKKQKHFVHTLNGSGLAIGRTIVAILENYQQKDGSVKIPDALREYTGFDEI